MTRFMRCMLKHSLMSLVFLAAGAQSSMAVCTGPLNLTVTKDLALGTLTRPDTGTADAIVTVGADGTRTLPANLKINSDTLNINKAPHAAVVDVTGLAGCSFVVTAAPTGDLTNVKFLPAQGYSLSGTGSGATGNLDALGRFRLSVGTSTIVGASNTIGGSISITVTYN